MGNTASRNDQRKTQTKQLSIKNSAGEQQKRVRKSFSATASFAELERAYEEESAAQRLQQTSTWSLGSLSGHFNWSFKLAHGKSSFRNRSKSTRKSLTALQKVDQQRLTKTVWHKPLTTAIFSTHFKTSSRNEQFEIEHLVAKGAFGVVFKVTDKQRQEQVNNSVNNQTANALPTSVYALKVLKKSKIIEERSVQQIKDEAAIQKVCGHHPFIVQQVDLWQNRYNLHILLEYLPNGELFSKIAHFSNDLIRLYVAEIALALDFLHNAGIIYRDAKPENILLTQSYHIKLIDFGLSKWLKLGATTKTMCGTFQYMAPEILRGEPYGHAVDWWSLGVIACQMYTQESPDIKSFLSVALSPKILADRPEADCVDKSVQKVDGTVDNKVAQSFLPEVVASLPHASKDVLQRLLTIDPKQRIHSVLALQRIALFKNFKIDSKHLLSLSPLDIIAKDNITIYKDESHSACLVEKSFQGF